MSGSRYSYAVTQLESQGVLNPDAHMFAQEDFYQAVPDKGYTTAAESELKQLHFRNTFAPMHWAGVN
jgi:hypothetical protein